MRIHRLAMAVAGAAALVAGSAQAAFIDFESIATNTDYTLLDFGDAELTQGAGAAFRTTTNALFAAPLVGRALTANNFLQDPFRLSFSGSVNYVQVGVGDLGFDQDDTYLRAFDGAGNELAADFFTIPAASGVLPFSGFLTVSAASDIAYVLFGVTDQATNSAYWDSITYDAVPAPVPLPAAAWLLGSGLLGLAGLARRRQSEV